MKEELTTTCKRIAFIMRELGYSPENFAKKTGTGIDIINGIISGKKTPSLQYLNTVSQLFPIRSQWLTSGYGDPWIPKIDLKKYKYDSKHGINRALKYGNEARFKRFKEVRERHSLSQVLYADKLDTSRDTIASIENGRQEVPMYLMEKLYVKFNINLNWLVGGDGDWKRSDEMSDAEKDARKLELLKELEKLS